MLFTLLKFNSIRFVEAWVFNKGQFFKKVNLSLSPSGFSASYPFLGKLCWSEKQDHNYLLSYGHLKFQHDIVFHRWRIQILNRLSALKDTLKDTRGFLIPTELMHEHFDLTFYKFKRAMKNKTSKTKINQPTKLSTSDHKYQ